MQVLRPALYALLVLSALFTFWSGGAVAGRTLPPWTRSVAPTIFAVFLAIFTVYRFALMRAKKYPAATGLFQVGLGALIWVLLLPSTRQKIRPPSAPVDDPEDFHDGAVDDRSGTGSRADRREMNPPTSTGPGDLRA